MNRFTKILSMSFLVTVFLALLMSGCQNDHRNTKNNQSEDNIIVLNDLQEDLIPIDDNGRCQEFTTLAAFEDDTFIVNGVSFTMKPVEGGSFLMGTQDEDPDGENYAEDVMVLPSWGPVHGVTLESYYLGETEVTQALWRAVMGKTIRQQRDDTDASSSLRGEGDDYPMYYVSWEDCQEFLHKLNGLTGKEFRLPTEAEWEYAAHGGRKSKSYVFAGSSDVEEVACYSEAHESYAFEEEEEAEMDESELPGICQVKSLKPNELGLYDMSGNVSEWCSDWYDEAYYEKSPSSNPQGPATGELRVVRGGSWFDLEEGCCVFSRGVQNPTKRSSDVGFRLVLSLK